MHAVNTQIIKKLDSFFSQFKPLKIKKDKVLYQPDDPISNIYFLKTGLIRQYSISEDGEEVTINIFRPNSFLPIMLILSNKPNKYFFEAQTNLEVFEAPFQKVLEFLQKEPTVLFDLTRRFAAAIGGLTTRIEELSFRQSEERIKSLLNYLAEKFGKNDKNGLLINLPLTHKDIATWVNLTRETTSRQLENLTKEGIISFNHQYITILNQKRLEEV